MWKIGEQVIKAQESDARIEQKVPEGNPRAEDERPLGAAEQHEDADQLHHLPCLKVTAVKGLPWGGNGMPDLKMTACTSFRL